MWSQNDALAGLAEAETKVDIVKRNGEAYLIHSPDIEIVGTSRQQTGGGNGTAFMRNP